MSSSVMAYRLRQRLQSAGFYKGKMCHSFRLGTLQHVQVEGADEAPLMALGQMRSTRTLMQYLVRNWPEDPIRRRPAPA